MRAFNFESGQWVDRAVEETHHNVYDGPVVSVTTKLAGIEDTVRCTVYHPFWVVDGRDLTERPFPRNLKDHESEGLSIRGRWVNSHDLRPSDKLYTHDGKEITVTKIEQEYDPAFAICNLAVATNHSYAVGKDAVLAHNMGTCDVLAEFEQLSPGRSRNTYLVDTDDAVLTLFDSLTVGAKPLTSASDQLRFLLDDGSTLVFRESSASGGAAIDLFSAPNIRGKRSVLGKIHVR